MYDISSPDLIKEDVNDCKEICNITSNTSYQEFFENFLIKNVPCVINNISHNWPASNSWVDNEKPNFSYLLSKYGPTSVCISNCKERYFNVQKTETFTLEKYVNYWENYIKSNYSKDLPLLYLKDWHLKKESDDNFYTIPIFFASDWLNEFFSEKMDDDYMFVYMGPKGTWTPFHADVFTSFSWSTNICGKKKWLLYPPGEELKLKDALGNLPYDVQQLEINCKYFEVIQSAGDAIFVPTGWHHQVWNLEDTISINHNWVNGCNIKNMWTSITENLTAVKKEIGDCKDMDNWIEYCQVVLKASYGMDFQMFYNFLFHIANKRIKMLQTNVVYQLFSSWKTSTNHAIFDLKRIYEVLLLFINHEDFCSLNFVSEHSNISPKELFKNIEEFLSKYN